MIFKIILLKTSLRKMAPLKTKRSRIDRVLSRDINCLIDLESTIIQPFCRSEVGQLEEYVNMITERLVSLNAHNISPKIAEKYYRLIIILFSALFLNRYVIETKGSENLCSTLNWAISFLSEKRHGDAFIREKIEQNLYFPPQF